MTRYIKFILLLTLVLFCSGYTGKWISVKRVVDGDTIVLANGKHVRYIGINAPETAHDLAPPEPLGYKSKAFNKKLVLTKKKIRLAFDKERFDHYGRLMAYVYTKKGLFVNLEMVKNGYAHVLYKKPNTKHHNRLLEAQRLAMKKGRGIWRLSPERLKGTKPYLGNKRSRRFHAVQCPFGKKTAPNNRIRFISRWDAFWNGYAPCKKCIPHLNLQKE